FGYACCSGNCADLNSDSRHCGSCNVACPSGQVCCSGKCCSNCCGAGICRTVSATMCDSGQLNQCMSDAQAAYKECLKDKPPSICNPQELNAEANCNCQFGCSPGSGVCCPSGECSHLNDTANCGTCGNACAPGQTCCAGSCTILSNDPQNCGACGNVCTGGKI